MKVLGGRLIQVREIHTHPPLAVVLGDQNDVGQPGRVFGFPNEPGRQQFVYFIFGGELPL